MKKGQASMEMLLTVVGFLAFLIPIILLIYSVVQMNQEDVSKYAAEALVKQITSTMEKIYTQGPGAKTTVFLNIPNNVEFVNITSSGEVVARLKTSTGYYDAVSHTSVNVKVPETTSEMYINKHGILPVSISCIGSRNTQPSVVVQEVGGQ